MVIMVTLQFLFTWQLVIMKMYMHERVRLSTMCYCSLMMMNLQHLGMEKLLPNLSSCFFLHQTLL